MRLQPVPFRMTLAALASAAMLAACGGGDASPPLDIIAPSLAISDNVSATNATGPVTFTFTFSEAVADFDASDIVVTGGTAGAFTLGATNRSATLVVTPGASTTGILAVSVAAGRFTDLAGNASTAAASASQAFDTRTITPPPPPPVANLVANGNFENGSTGWIGNAVDVRTEGGNSFNFANVTAVGNPFDVNISYPLSIPTQGVRYRLTFTASSDRNRTMLAGIGLNEGPFTNDSVSVDLTTTPQTFVRELTANFASANSRVLFDMGAAIGTVVIDDVVLEVITTTPPPPPPPPPAMNLVANGNFENGSTGWIGNAVDVRTEGGNSFNFANVTAVGNPFDVNISYPLSIPTQGVRYRLTFTASSDRNRTMLAGIGLNEGPFTNDSVSVDLTTTPQTFVRELTANFASANSRVLFDMGAAIGTVVIDDVILEVITTPPPPPPPPGGALTFSSGFASNVLTAEGGLVASAGGSDLDGFNCNGAPEWCGSGAGGTGAESFMFFYYQTPSPATALYSQVEVFGPGVTGFSTTGDTAGVTVTNQTKVNFTFNPSPEWYNSTNNRFAVVLTLGRRYAIDGGCRLQLHGVRAPTAPGSTAYSMNLRNDFRVAADCGTGIAPTDVAAALAASPVISSVKFLGAAGGAAIIGRNDVASGANLSTANGDGVYPTTVALRGGITFD